MLKFKFTGTLQYSDKTNEEAISVLIHDALDKVARVSGVEVKATNITPVKKEKQ